MGQVNKPYFYKMQKSMLGIYTKVPYKKAYVSVTYRTFFRITLKDEGYNNPNWIQSMEKNQTPYTINHLFHVKENSSSILYSPEKIGCKKC